MVAVLFVLMGVCFCVWGSSLVMLLSLVVERYVLKVTLNVIKTLSGKEVMSQQWE